MAAGTIIQKTPNSKLPRSFTRAAAPLALAVGLAGPVQAGKKTPAIPVAAAASTAQCYAWAVTGPDGQLIPELSHNADKPVLTASIAKLMTAIIINDLITSGKISLEDRIPVRTPYTEAGYCNPQALGKHNSTLTYMSVNEALIATLTISSNSGGLALGNYAAHVSGLTFPELAHNKAQALKLLHTDIRSPNGMNDGYVCNKIPGGPRKVAETLAAGSIDTTTLNISSPEDLTHLTKAVSERPILRERMQHKSYADHPATNKLIYKGVLGKTGYTPVAGTNFGGFTPDGFFIAVSHCSGHEQDSESSQKKAISARFSWFRKTWDEAKLWITKKTPTAPRLTLLSTAVAAPAASSPTLSLQADNPASQAEGNSGELTFAP